MLQQLDERTLTATAAPPPSSTLHFAIRHKLCTHRALVSVACAPHTHIVHRTSNMKNKFHRSFDFTVSRSIELARMIRIGHGRSRAWEITSKLNAFLLLRCNFAFVAIVQRT